MKNSMFIFAAAAFFMMTSCTMSEDDIPTPINDQIATEIYEGSQTPQNANELQLVSENSVEKGSQLRVSGLSNANELEEVKQKNSVVRTDCGPGEPFNRTEDELSYHEEKMSTESIGSKKKNQFDQRDYEKERLKKKYYYHQLKDKN